MSKWISVKDKPPALFDVEDWRCSENVLVYDLSDHGHGSIEIAIYWSDGAWQDVDGVCEFNNVTHWMPLPEPPNDD